MRRLLLGAMMASALMTPIDAQDVAVADIPAVISQQLEAFRQDDFAKAFGFASPSIQGMFGTPDRFGDMVRQAYPMVWRPADVTFLEQAEIGAEIWQKVRVRDGEGGVHDLAYKMIADKDGFWRINGVERFEVPGTGV